MAVRVIKQAETGMKKWIQALSVMAMATWVMFAQPHPVSAAADGPIAGGLTPVHLTSNRFVIKLKNAVELSRAPSLRRLEKEGDLLSEVMVDNQIQAQWLRAGVLGSHVMQWQPHVKQGDRESLIYRLRSDPRVEFVEVDRPLSGQLSPNDASFSSQWALLSTARQSGARFDKAWDLIRGSANVVVAVVDTGVVLQTPELAGRLLKGYDFVSDPLYANDGDGRDADPSDPGDWITEADRQMTAFADCPVANSTWHGTFIAGQIAALSNNKNAVAGADWNARILPVRVSGKCRAYSSDLFDGMLWAAGLDVPAVPANPNPAQVINVSLGAPSECGALAQSVMARVNAAGTLVVSSAGNGGAEAYLPANCPNVISVAAVDQDGTRAFYSAIGPSVHIAAPGGYFNGLLGLGNSGTLGPQEARPVSKTGTSFASPLVAAAASLVKAANPQLSPIQIREILLKSTQPFLTVTGKRCAADQGKATCDCTVGVCGAGMLDAAAAIQAARATRPLANAAIGLNGSASTPLQLSASASTVTAGRKVAQYKWEQIAGDVVLKNPSSEPELSLPKPNALTDLMFRLTVQDTAGESHTALAAMRVNADPNNSTAAAPAPSEVVVSASPSNGGQASPSNTGNATSALAANAPVASSGGGGGGSLSWLGLLGLTLLLMSYRLRSNRAYATRPTQVPPR